MKIEDLYIGLQFTSHRWFYFLPQMNDFIIYDIKEELFETSGGIFVTRLNDGESFEFSIKDFNKEFQTIILNK